MIWSKAENVGWHKYNGNEQCNETHGEEKLDRHKERCKKEKLKVKLFDYEFKYWYKASIKA